MASDDANKVREEMQEAGYPAPSPPPVTGPSPPGKGQWAVPYYQQFAGVMNLMARVHHWTYDDAIADSRINARVMRDDPVIRSAIDQRIYPVSLLEWHLEPEDETDQSLIDQAQKITAILEAIPKFQDMKRWLLEDTFFGRSAVQLTTGWDYSLGYKRCMVQNWSHVHADSILFKYDDQTPGILVNGSQFKGNKEPTPRGMCHFLYDPNELELFLWSEFEPEAVDFYQPERTGAIHGLGYRGRLYWWWWLRDNLTRIMMDFLEKIGTGITIFYYEAGNDKSLADVAKAAEEQIGNNAYLFPRARDGTSAYAGPGIERIEPSMVGASFFLEVFREINSIIRNSILGESATTEAVAAGMGGSGPDQHGITADLRTKYDANRLEYPMQRLVNAITRWNYPGSPSPKFRFLVDKRNPEEFMKAVAWAVSVGLEVSENQVRDELGLPKPKPGEATLGNVSPMQPTAVGQIPTGMPMTAPGGPSAQALPPGPPQQALPAPPVQGPPQQPPQQ